MFKKKLAAILIFLYALPLFLNSSVPLVSATITNSKPPSFYFNGGWSPFFSYSGSIAPASPPYDGGGSFAVTTTPYLVFSYGTVGGYPSFAWRHTCSFTCSSWSGNDEGAIYISSPDPDSPRLIFNNYNGTHYKFVPSFGTIDWGLPQVYAEYGSVYTLDWVSYMDSTQKSTEFWVYAGGHIDDPAYLIGNSSLYLAASFGNTTTYFDSTMTVGITKYGGSVNMVYFSDHEIYSPTVLPVISADLENIDDFGADWVFTEWRYYTFSMTIPSTLYSGSLDTPCLRFVLKTFNGSVLCGVWEKDSKWNFVTNSSAYRDLQAIRVKAGTVSVSSSNTTITYPIWFTSQCLDIYEVADAVDVEVAWNDTTGAAVSWFVGAPGFFRVYNKGGFAQNYTTVGNAHAITGGEQFAFHAENGSFVYRDEWFRDVQHMKLLPEVQCIAGYQTFYLSYGVDYSIGTGVWLPGWRVVIAPSFVSYTGIFAANVWVNMTVSWQNGNSSAPHELPPDTEYLYMFYHGNAGNVGDLAKWKMWIDLWFNSINASSTGGGRVNAYEYPMEDSSAVWLRWLSSNWGVKDDVKKESNFMGGLYDLSDTIMSSERIQMVRYWSSLEVVPNPFFNQKVDVTNFDVIDLTKSKSLPLTGIQTPVFDETKMPVVGNSGILGALWSMFSGIGQWIGDNILFGGLSLWPTFVNFLDTIAGWLGMPNGFSNLLAWLGTGWGWLVSGFTYALSIIADIFLFLAQVMGSFIWAIGQAIASFIVTLAAVASWIGGGISGVGNLWNELGLSTWFTVGLIFYPLYLIILWDQEGMDAVLKQLGLIWGILSWLAHFFLRIIDVVINIMGRIIESIPVVE